MKTGRMTLPILVLCAAAAAAAGAAVSAARAGTPAAESAPPQAGAPAYGPGPVYVLEIKDEEQDKPQIVQVPGADDGLAISNWNLARLRRAIGQATGLGASVFLVEISSYGGSVLTMEKMGRELLNVSGMRTIALVKGQAISAGAYVALACDEIHMNPASTIGAATPWVMGPDGGPVQTPPEVTEKRLRLVTETFRAMAKENGHSQELAGAMVDPATEVVAARVDGRIELMTREQFDEARKKADRRTLVEESVVVQKGKVLVMTAADAVKWGLAASETHDRATLLGNLGLAGRPVIESKVTWADGLARFFSSGLVVMAMIAVAMLALYMELSKPSGVGAGVGLTALAVFFWANYLAGTAGPVSIIVFLLGVALLVVEIFFIPGFGWTGISGIALMTIGMVAARLPADFFRPAVPEFAPPRMHLTGLLDALAPLAVGLATGSVGIAVLMRFFPRLPLLNRLVLRTDLSGAVVTAAQAAGEASPESMIGMVGTATTTLRPGGTAGFGDRLLDVVSDGDFIEAGTPVRIVSASGNRIVVRRN